MTALERKALLEASARKAAEEKSAMWERLIRSAIEKRKAAGLPVDEDGES